MSANSNQIYASPGSLYSIAFSLLTNMSGATTGTVLFNLYKENNEVSITIPGISIASADGSTNQISFTTPLPNDFLAGRTLSFQLPCVINGAIVPGYLSILANGQMTIFTQTNFIGNCSIISTTSLYLKY